MAGVTAWRGLRQVGGVRPGERVLVTGAAGGVGSFGVQLARHLGARVTAACRADKQEAVRGLGVDDVLTVDDALAARDAFDVILDCAADRSPFAWRRALRAGGRHVLVGGALLPLLQTNLLGALVGAVSGRRFRGLLSAPDAALLAEVLALVADGTVRPLITQRLDLDDAGTGIALVEERRAIGKVIIDVAG
jgi:NADPH:quinone reductase-like Zn-dependent oxidoreductase